jgi:Raf kinase inhibitor-like YbhB/YbcL family protein
MAGRKLEMIALVVLLLGGAFTMVFYFATAGQAPEGTMELSSAAFEDMAEIPVDYTCNGKDLLPPLSVSGVPEGTVSLAFVMDDPDAPGGTWDHWILWNVAPDTTDVAEGREPEGVSGRNDFGNTGYGGPCPPARHTYRFKVYALDAELDLAPGSSKKQLEAAMKGHILDQALLRGQYEQRR